MATAGQHSTAAVVTLYLVATWVLMLVARPLALWKVAMVPASLAAFSYALLSPWIFGKVFWDLDASDHATMLVALIVAAAGMVLLMISWMVLDRRCAASPEAAAAS
ncbi:hypothetical protein [Pseudonocardia sp. GCM10023141]|uniref:hypothetical protein n=1 Tax=Pseudonocardia sp. GCM10023141 TaxID=3252653 RepID=UPI00361A7D52